MLIVKVFPAPDYKTFLTTLLQSLLKKLISKGTLVYKVLQPNNFCFNETIALKLAKEAGTYFNESIEK